MTVSHFRPRLSHFGQTLSHFRSFSAPQNSHFWDMVARGKVCDVVTSGKVATQ